MPSRFEVRSDFVGPLKVYDKANDFTLVIYGKFQSYKSACEYCESIAAALNAYKAPKLKRK